MSCLRVGAVGNIPGPEIADRLVIAYEAERRGDAASADSLHGQLLPYLVFSLQTLDHFNACSKQVLIRRGVLRRGGLRRPAPDLAPLAYELLEKYLAEAGLDDRLFEDSGAAAPPARNAASE